MNRMQGGKAVVDPEFSGREEEGEMASFVSTCASRYILYLHIIIQNTRIRAYVIACNGCFMKRIKIGDAKRGENELSTRVFT